VATLCRNDKEVAIVRTMTHFVLAFDRRSGTLLSNEPFADADMAGARYVELERAHRASPGVEVVLLGSESLTSLRQTHGRFFRNCGTPSKFAELLAR
jgi:hypothetical protein